MISPYWGDSKYKNEGVGKVLHSLTEDGKVEVVDIKFNKKYENVSVKHLTPTDESSHSPKESIKN